MSLKCDIKDYGCRRFKIYHELFKVPDKKTLAKNRLPTLTEEQEKLYSDCQRRCDVYYKDSEVDLTVCSNSLQTFENACKLDCDRKFIQPMLRRMWTGNCDDRDKTLSYDDFDEDYDRMEKALLKKIPK